MEKDKTKPIEEVIDVVGDFGPGPSGAGSSKQEEPRYSTGDDSFGMSFDMSANVSENQALLLQQQQFGGKFNSFKAFD